MRACNLTVAQSADHAKTYLATFLLGHASVSGYEPKSTIVTKSSMAINRENTATPSAALAPADSNMAKSSDAIVSVSGLPV